LGNGEVGKGKKTKCFFIEPPSEVIQQFPIPHNWQKCKYTSFLTRSILGTGLFSWHNVGEELDDGRFLKKHVRKSRKKIICKPRNQSPANETKCRSSPKKRRIDYLDSFVTPKIKKRRIVDQPFKK